MILFTALVVVVVSATLPGTRGQTVEELQTQVDDLTAKLEDVVKNFGDLARQTMLQQFTVEEKIRSDGDSGIKTVRGHNKGPENYYASSHFSEKSFISMHDHTNHKRMMGLGEMLLVLNGVEFRTRHNDYKLRMPSTTSTNYRATENVPPPDVPEEVTRLGTVPEQIQEMREFFKAFKFSNHTHRDYRPYFKPVMCYLEGTWTLDKDIQEPFESERHHLDASSWFELLENVRYAAYTGTKSRLENFAYLPTTIMSVNETTGIPNYAQWNYRVICHPIEEHVPLKYLRQEEDLSYRYPRGQEMKDYFYTRAARFKLFEYDSPRFTSYSLIDRIFSQIPGMDNIPDNLTENAFGEEMYKFDEKVKLNAGYYHRWFKFSKPGAMGLTTVARGFNDENMWVAMTTQNRVAPMALQVCTKKNKWKKNSPQTCVAHNNRFSFAIPIEIVYMTPVMSWNPYNLTVHDKGGIANADGRTGSHDKPYDGVDESRWFLTPDTFYSGDVSDDSDPADTGSKGTFVLNQDGEKRRVLSSGTSLVTRVIEGVGRVRLRYPIAPVYGEGSSVWKELNALRDYVFEHRGSDDDEDEGETLPAVIEFHLSTVSKPTEHYHSFYVARDDYLAMKDNPDLTLRVETDTSAGHTHSLLISWSKKRGFEYLKCDNQKTCWDKHKKKFFEVRNS